MMSSTSNKSLLQAGLLGVGALAVGLAGYLTADALSGPSSRDGIPLNMKSVYLSRYMTPDDLKDASKAKDCLEVRQIPTPVPARGQVLVRIERSPINPADLMMMQGQYNRFNRPPLPHQMGFEGSGVVVQSGGGMAAKKLLGKRVFLSGQGLWSQYVSVPVGQCVPLPEDVSFEEGCAMFVNPMTVVAFVELAKEGKHKAILHTAAAGALGKMLIAYARRQGIEVVCVVRRPSQKAELERLGAKYVVDTSQDEKVWQDELTKACEETDCRLGFDAVGGRLTGQVASCMPLQSNVKVYGGLSAQPAGSIDLVDLIFGGKIVDGFWLVPYLKAHSPLHALRMIGKVMAHVKDEFRFTVAGRHSLDDMGRAVVDYAQNMSEGKILMAPTLSL